MFLFCVAPISLNVVFVGGRHRHLPQRSCTLVVVYTDTIGSSSVESPQVWLWKCLSFPTPLFIMRSLLSLSLFLTTGTRSVTFAAAFCTAPSLLSSNKMMQQSTIRNLVAAPMEEKEKEDIGNNEQDWISIPGGFFPNLNKGRMQEVTTLQEYKDVVVNERNKIVVVHFYAPWCRSCKAMAPQLAKMRNSLGDTVKFVKVPVTPETVMIHQGLGVPSVPFGHIYHPDVGLVEEMKMSKTHWNDFATVLRHYVDGVCDIPPEHEPEDFE